MSRVSQVVDRIGVRFDEPNLVANAGLLLVGTLAVRLDLERLIDKAVCLSGRVGGGAAGPEGADGGALDRGRRFPHRPR